MRGQLRVTAIEPVPSLAMKVIDRQGNEKRLGWPEEEFSVEEYFATVWFSPVRGRILSIEEPPPLEFRGHRRQRAYRVTIADEEDERQIIGITVPQGSAQGLEVGQVAHVTMFAPPLKVNVESPLLASITPEPRQIRVTTLPKKWWGRYEVTLQETRPPVTAEVNIPTLRLHCPRTEGCTASFTRKMRRSQRRGFSAKILGIGGGTSLQVTYEQVETIRTKGPCLEQLERVKVAYRYGNLLADQHVIAFGYPRVDILEHVESLGLHNISKTSDLCGSDPERVRSLVADYGYEEDTIKFSGTTPRQASQEFEFLFGQETTANLYATFQVQLGGVPITMGVEYERGMALSIGTKYRLVSGKNYQWYKLPQSIERYWAVR